MKALSTVIIVMLLAGSLFSVSGSIKAQQSSDTTQQLSKRLLDAVDGNDVEAVRSLLAIASGRSLVALPIGLTAAGRAVERGYYEVAHHILAVRNQQIQLERDERTANPSNERGYPAAVPLQSASPAKRPISPPLRLDRQTPKPLAVTDPTPAATPIPKAKARTGDPAPKSPPPLFGPNPFEPSHTPEIELPRVHPVDQPDNRSDKSDTFPAARVAPPPDLPLRGSPKSAVVDTTPNRNLPTPIGPPIGATKPEKSGFFGRLLGTVSDTFIPSDSEPEADNETPDTPETVSSSNPSHMTGGTPMALSESTRPPEGVNLTENAPPSDGILSNLTEFFTSSGPPENTLATLTLPAPAPIASITKVNTNDEPSAKAELTKPGKSISQSGKSPSSGPEAPGFIDLIKKVLRYETLKPEPAAEEPSVSTTIAAKLLEPSPLNPSENIGMALQQSGQATARTIGMSSPLPAKPVASEPENDPPTSQTHNSSTLAPDVIMPPVHIQVEKKSNPFQEKFQVQEKSIPPPSRAPTASSAVNAKAPAKSVVTQLETRATAIRLGSTNKMPATAAIARFEKSRSRQRTALPQMKAPASGTPDRKHPMFRIGKSLTLGLSLNPKAIASGECFRKGLVTDWYCLEQADWPQEMAKARGLSAWHYREASTVVLYKSGKAVRIYSVIPSNTYDDAIKYYTSLLGPPTKFVTDKLVRLGNTPLSNHSSTWIYPSKRGGMETLEIRRFDNIRGFIASDTVGFIRLFEENSNPIFAVLSDTDLILHQIRSKNKKR